MKRTKQVQVMVDYVNNMFERNKVISEYDNDFMLMQSLLLTAKCYKGYNWYYYREYTDIMGEVTLIPTHTGTSDEEELKKLDAYIQLY